MVPRNVAEHVVEVEIPELLPEQPEEPLLPLLLLHLQPEEAVSLENPELPKLLGSKCSSKNRREKEWVWLRRSPRTP